MVFARICKKKAIIIIMMRNRAESAPERFSADMSIAHGFA